MSERQIGLPGNSEDMALFFDTRAPGYEQHMRENIADFETFYRSIGDALPDLSESPSILNLGIGTGLELDHLFERFPDASVVGIDLSATMLGELSRKSRPWISQVKLLVDSFLEADLGRSMYDAVISSMALHHWIPHVKLELYQRAYDSLRPGGVLVNGDYIETKAESLRRLAEFESSGIDHRHQQHIDLPLSMEQERELLSQAGFGDIRIPFIRANACVFVASKG